MLNLVFHILIWQALGLEPNPPPTLTLNCADQAARLVLPDTLDFKPIPPPTTYPLDVLTAAAITRWYPDAEVRVIGSGGENIILLLSPPGKTPIAAAIPRTDPQRHKRTFERYQEILKDISTQFGPEALSYFVPVNRIRTTHDITIAEMPYFPAGSLHEHLHLLGPSQSFSQTLSTMKRLVTPVKKIHSLGWFHNDIKPKNFLIALTPDGNALSEIRLADFGFAGGSTPDRQPYRFGVSLNYIHPEWMSSSSIIDSLTNNGNPLSGTTAQKDMHALKVALQEVLLGSELEDLAPEHTLTTHAGSHAITTLNGSPHEIDSRVPETLSTITSIEFSTTESLDEALTMAERFQYAPNQFYRHYLGPKLLEKANLPTVVGWLKSDRSLRDRLFQSPGALGLSKERREALISALQSPIDPAR